MYANQFHISKFSRLQRRRHCILQVNMEVQGIQQKYAPRMTNHYKSLQIARSRLCLMEIIQNLRYP